MKARFARATPKRGGATNGLSSKGAELAAFGRPGASAAGYFPSDLGCPDCRGVLFVTELGKHGLLSFRCRVGHVFSAESLLEFKEDRLDEALWTSLELGEELAQLYAIFSKQGPGRRFHLSAPIRKALVKRVARQRQLLRALMESEESGAAPKRPRNGRRV